MRSPWSGYAVETPRLLLASATDRYPDGLANGSGLVGRWCTWRMEVEMAPALNCYAMTR